MLQATGDDPVQWHANISAICGHYGYWVDSWAGGDEKDKAELLMEAAGIIDRLPGRLQQPDLGQFLSDQFFASQSPARPDRFAVLRKIGGTFVSFGL